MSEDASALARRARVEACLAESQTLVGTHTMLPRSASVRRLGRATRGIDVLGKWRMGRLGDERSPGNSRSAHEFAGEAKRFFLPGGDDEFFGRRGFRSFPKGAGETLPRQVGPLG